MIVATLLTALGFFLTAAITQTKGLRLGGAIVVPTIVVYSLTDFITLPVFVVSTIIGYLLLWVAKERTLVYGRDEFLVSLAAGSLVPLVLYLVLSVVRPALVQAHPVVFVGSILPGLAAFNISQTKPEYRRKDILYTSALIVALILLGAVLISPWLGRRIGSLTPLILFAKTSDIAVFRGAVVEGILVPNVDIRTTIIAVLIVGMLLGEWVRREFGIRLGIISLALLALFSLASRWLLVVFVICFALTLVSIWLLHTQLLLYGRVLISLGCGMGVLAALGCALVLPVIRGFSVLFIGVIAGVTAYAIHATPPRDRRQQLVLILGVFAAMLLLARTVVTPFERGVLQTFGIGHVVVAAVVIFCCVAVASYWQIPAPDDESILSASILSGGDG